MSLLKPSVIKQPKPKPFLIVSNIYTNTLLQVRLALEQAEQELESRQHAPLGELQQWLQLTYELESLHYEAKRELAVKQLRAAKDMVRTCNSSWG